MLAKKNELEELGIILIDILAVLMSVYITAIFTKSSISNISLWILIFIHITAFYISNTFDEFFYRGCFDELKSLTYYLLSSVSIITFMIFATEKTFLMSRMGVLIYCISNFIFLYIIHTILKFIYSKTSESKRAKKIFLITTFDRLDDINERLKKVSAWGGEITAVSFVGDAEVEVNTIQKYFPNIDYIPWNEIEHYAVQNVVDEVFINLSQEYDGVASELINVFEVMGFDISMNIRRFDVSIPLQSKITTLAGFQVVTFSHKFHNYGELFLKRLIDILGSLVGIFFTIIIGFVVVPMIMIESPGNPIYVSNRVGKNGRIFKFYKFRSMFKDADLRKKELMNKNQIDGLMFKIDNDPRVTKIGNILRKTSIDELPQFYNVLKGDMSLVGTRPPTEDEYRLYSSHHKKRLSFRPGITGLWQVSGRSDIKNFEDVLNLDVEYINNWNIWLDIKILILTLKVVLLGKGAK